MKKNKKKKNVHFYEKRNNFRNQSVKYSTDYGNDSVYIAVVLTVSP